MLKKNRRTEFSAWNFARVFFLFLLSSAATADLAGDARAAEGCRSPRRWRECADARPARSVLDCGSPLPLFTRTGSRLNIKTLISLLLLLALPLLRAENFDVLIRHGLVVDGTGNPGFHADVAVKDGRIAVIGKIDGSAKEEIDAAGLVVAPGFIDVHTHADDVADLPRAENFLRMGVTSIVVGNCGSSDLDLAKLFRDIERKKVSLNVASLIATIPSMK